MLTQEEEPAMQDAINKCNAWAMLQGWSVRKRPFYIREGCTWTNKEYTALYRLFLNGKSFEQICNIHGRSPEVIFDKIYNYIDDIVSAILHIPTYKTKQFHTHVTQHFDEIYNLIYNLNQFCNDYFRLTKKKKSKYNYQFIETLFLAYLIVENKFNTVDVEILFSCDVETLLRRINFNSYSLHYYFDSKLLEKNCKKLIKKYKNDKSTKQQ